MSDLSTPVLGPGALQSRPTGTSQELNTPACTGRTLIEAARDRVAEIAREHGLEVIWRSVANTVPFTGVFSEPLLVNVVAQLEAAFRTVLRCSNQLPRNLVFLLNTSGLPIPAESLLYGWFRTRIQRQNFMATCELRPLAATVPETDRDDDSVVLWIDDPTVPLAPRQPYSSRFKSYLALNFPILSDAVRYNLVNHANRHMAREVEYLRRDCEKIYFPPALPYPAPNSVKTILFCLYWLDFGGAESFALEQIELAHMAGYRIIITCDELRRHRLLEKARQYADAIYLIQNFSFKLTREDAMMRIIREHQPDVIHIHHSFVMYRVLPLVRMLQLPVRVIDTTHILENRFGIFPKESVAHSEFIDLHHVISHELKRFYTDLGRIPERRIRVGKLHELSKPFRPAPSKWDHTNPLRVVFIGRFVQQKRPYLFVEIARRLARRFGRDRFQFQSVGDGDLYKSVQQQFARSGLGNSFQFLPSDAPTADLLAEAHVLVIPSDNEGLTLVGFEAGKADCIVISTDVGAQRELVPPELLVPRRPFACLYRSVAIISGLIDGRLDAQRLLQTQRTMLERNLAEPSGTDVCLQFYNGSGNTSALAAGDARTQISTAE